jgi:hypothetical protein
MTIEKDSINDAYLINNRYAIYKYNGAVYDTERAEDIPQDIFALRDVLLRHEHKWVAQITGEEEDCRACEECGAIEWATQCNHIYNATKQSRQKKCKQCGHITNEGDNY